MTMGDDRSGTTPLVLMLGALIGIVVLLLTLSGCGSSAPAQTAVTTFPAEPPPVSFEYSKSDVTPWPWTVNAMVVVCPREPGGNTVAAAEGKRYIIVGPEVSSDGAGGFAKRAQIMIDPSNTNPSTQAFETRVKADCGL